MKLSVLFLIVIILLHGAFAAFSWRSIFTFFFKKNETNTNLENVTQSTEAKTPSTVNDIVDTTPNIVNYRKPKKYAEPECYNADGEPGTCVDINDYSIAMTRLNDTKFIADSLCLVDGKNVKVCYSPLPRKPKRRGDCDKIVSAFPPDPRTECCGKEANLQKRISGGEVTTIEQYPWLAIIKFQNDRSKCGGILISNRYVLTAAHCVFPSKPNRPVEVILGEYDLLSDEDCDISNCADDPITIKIEEVISHPGFNPTDVSRKNDIALVRLQEPTPYTKFIRPICLPDAMNAIAKYPPPKLKLTVAGWGRTDPDHPFSNLKRHAKLRNMDMRKCSKHYKGLWSNQMCAGGESIADSCKGDSGGPLMYCDDEQYQVFGVVSFGRGLCGVDIYPGVYTKVAAYNTWIRRHILP